MHLAPIVSEGDRARPTYVLSGCPQMPKVDGRSNERPGSATVETVRTQMTSWTPRGVAARAAAVLREEGVRSLWFKVLGETVYRRAQLFERPCDEPIPEVPARVPVIIGLLEPTGVDEYVAFRPGSDADDVRSRLAAGQLCFVARHQGRIVHAGWAATGRVRVAYLGCELQLSPGEVYVYGSYTVPDFRGKDIPSQRYGRMLRFLRDAGYRRAVCAVMPENVVAFRPIEKAGFRPIGVMGYVKIGRRRHDFRRTRGRSQLPGASGGDHGPAYWDTTIEARHGEPHYLDEFLGALKREAYLGLLQRWARCPAAAVLKTDLFEEAMGPDAFLMDLCDRARMVIGMDVSIVAARAARVRDTRGRARYVVADVCRLPFAGGSLPLVVSPSTLDHFSDPRDLRVSLRELARVLEPGGDLILTVDNRQNVFDPLLRLAIRLGRVPFFIGRSYTVEELRAELVAAGFRVRETTAILHNPRLVAVASVTLAKKLRWRALTGLVQRSLTAAQGLERTRFRYFTGSFLAAVATPNADANASP